MSKHLYEGKEFPVFFYGQSYGFSFLETLPIALMYCFTGVIDIAVKLPMLALWSLGIIFFYLTLKQLSKNNKWLPLLVTIIFILSPSWAVWSMKARGGYITAFLLSFVFIYFLFNPKCLKRVYIFFLLGVLISFIYQSQSLWLPGLIPLYVHKLWATRSLKNLAGTFTGLVTGIIFFFILKLFTVNSYYGLPAVFNFDISNLKNIALVPKYIFQHIKGFYYLGDFYKADFFVTVFSFVLTSAIFLMLCASIYFYIKKRKENVLYFLLSLPVFFTLAYSVFISHFSGRYLLPLSGFVFLLLYIMMDKIRMKILRQFIIILFISLGSLSVYSFKDYSFSVFYDQYHNHIYDKKQFNEKKEICSIISFMENNNINYTFSTDGLLQWQIMFYSKEQIISRYIFNTDRYPDYIKQVNEAFLKKHLNTAVISNSFNLYGLSRNDVIDIGHYHIYINPSMNDLIKLGFIF